MRIQAFTFNVGAAKSLTEADWKPVLASAAWRPLEALRADTGYLLKKVALDLAPTCKTVTGSAKASCARSYVEPRSTSATRRIVIVFSFPPTSTQRP